MEPSFTKDNTILKEKHDVSEAVLRKIAKKMRDFGYKRVKITGTDPKKKGEQFGVQGKEPKANVVAFYCYDTDNEPNAWLGGYEFQAHFEENRSAMSPNEFLYLLNEGFELNEE